MARQRRFWRSHSAAVIFGEILKLLRAQGGPLHLPNGSQRRILKVTSTKPRQYRVQTEKEEVTLFKDRVRIIHLEKVEKPCPIKHLCCTEEPRIILSDASNDFDVDSNMVVIGIGRGGDLPSIFKTEHRDRICAKGGLMYSYARYYNDTAKGSDQSRRCVDEVIAEANGSSVFVCLDREKDVCYAIEDQSLCNKAIRQWVTKSLVHWCSKIPGAVRQSRITLATIQDGDYNNIEIMRKVYEAQIAEDKGGPKARSVTDSGCLTSQVDYPGITVDGVRYKLHLVMAAINYFERTGKCMPSIGDPVFAPNGTLPSSVTTKPLILTKRTQLHGGHFCGNKRCSKKDHVDWIHAFANVRLHELCHQNPGKPCFCAIVTGRRCVVKKQYSHDNRKQIKNDFLWLALASMKAADIQSSSSS